MSIRDELWNEVHWGRRGIDPNDADRLIADILRAVKGHLEIRLIEDRDRQTWGPEYVADYELTEALDCLGSPTIKEKEDELLRRGRKIVDNSPEVKDEKE